MSAVADNFCTELRADMAKRYFETFGDSPRGPDGEHMPSRRILLALAWMQEVTAYWQAQYDSWSPENKRIADAARRLAALEADPDEIVAGGHLGSQPVIVRCMGHAPLHAPSLLGQAQPLWVHFLTVARAVLLEGVPAPVKQVPQPAEPLTVEQ